VARKLVLRIFLVVPLATLTPLMAACPAASDTAAPTPAASSSGAGETTASGLVIEKLVVGDGPSPKATDVVRVHYHGTFPGGEVFDSSVERGQPARFPLNRVIPCWTEGLQLMKVGGKARLTCPPGIAYGAQGAPPTIPPNATLSFDVELLGIE
jgi:FKBP-type peptidyl-prolyl cis-trans isomerase FkpA